MDTKNEGITGVDQKLDCEGFLSDSEFWSIDLAEKLAKDNEIADFGLTELHWEVINYVRDYYEKYEKGPEMVKVARHCGISMDDMCNLFPCGLVRGAYKLAGLPRPPGCI